MTWGMISYNINLRMGVDGKIYMPYAEALIGTYWPDAVQLVIAEEMGMKLEDVIVYYAPNYNNWQNGDAADRGSHLHVGGEGGGRAAEGSRFSPRARRCWRDSPTRWTSWTR